MSRQRQHQSIIVQAASATGNTVGVVGIVMVALLGLIFGFLAFIYVVTVTTLVAGAIFGVHYRNYRTDAQAALYLHRAEHPDELEAPPAEVALAIRRMTHGIPKRHPIQVPLKVLRGGRR